MAGKLTFTPKGDAQSCYKLTLHTASTTAISQLRLPSADGSVYNMMGNKVSHPGKGLYIINGKKVIIP